jgi:hypothetical protein
MCVAAQETKVCTVLPNIFSKIILVFLYILKYMSSHAVDRQHQIIVRFIGHSRIVGFQCGTSFYFSGTHNLKVASGFWEICALPSYGTLEELRC